MQIYGGGEELAKKKDIVNPNLLKDSKNIIIDKDHCNGGDPAGSNWWLIKDLDAPLQAGDNITLSFYVNSMTGGTYNDSFGLCLWKHGMNGEMASDYSYKFKLNAINVIHWTITASDDEPQISLHGGNYAEASGPNTQIKLSDFKIERGSIATPWCPAYEDYAMKSDLPTKLLAQDVDINTLTDEGSFFVESSNLDHFPAAYRNQWYFLNVTNAVGPNGIKQTVTPDNSDSKGWTMTRTGSYNADTHILEWKSWLISDFANGKLLRSK